MLIMPAFSIVVRCYSTLGIHAAVADGTSVPQETHRIEGDTWQDTPIFGPMNSDF